MKKEKFLIDIAGSVILLFFGSFLILNSIIRFDGIKSLVSIFFGIYAIIHFALFLNHKEEKEYSHAALGMIGVLFFGLSFYQKFLDTSKNLSLFLLFFALFSSFIKLKKADYFHDRKNILWRLEISILLFFLLTTVLVVINFTYPENIKIIIFGFYIYLIGLLEFFEALIFNWKGKLQ